MIINTYECCIDYKIMHSSASTFSALGREREKEKDKAKSNEVTPIVAIDKDKRAGKPSKEKSPAASTTTTAAAAAAVIPNVSQPNVTWQLENERGVMKNQVLTISKIAHPLNSMHTCYTITCAGNQCPSVRQPDPTSPRIEITNVYHLSVPHIYRISRAGADRGSAV